MIVIETHTQLGRMEMSGLADGTKLIAEPYDVPVDVIWTAIRDENQTVAVTCYGGRLEIYWAEDK